MNDDKVTRFLWYTGVYLKITPVAINQAAAAAELHPLP